MSPVEGFTICREYLTSSVTLLVRGELDIATGDELAAVLAAVADKDHLRVVLDLAECDFVDAAGLHVIADAAQDLDRRGGELSVRSPSGVARRLFDLVEPIPFVIASTAGTSPTSRGSDESTGVQRMAALASPARSTSRLRELVTIPVPNHPVPYLEDRPR